MTLGQQPGAGPATADPPAATMTAAVLHGRGDLRIEEVPYPGPPRADEVLIAVRAVGLCGTDISEFRAGPIQVPLTRPHPVTGHRGPTVLGHEFSGVVVDTGADVPPDWRGRLVVCGGAVHCGRCPACRSGRSSQCERYYVTGLHRHGGLASHVTVPARACAPAGTDQLTAEEVALAQPMAIAVHAARRGGAQRGQRAIVTGVGGIGACLVYVLSQWGVAVTAVDVDPARRRVATELGARDTVGADGDLTAAALVAHHGGPPALVFEATGVPEVLEAVLGAAAVGARIVNVGMQKNRVTLDVRRLTLREQQLIGTNSLVAQSDLPEALRLLAARAGRWDVLAPEVVPLTEVVAAGLARDGAAMAIKTLVDPSATHRRTLYPVPC
jgi:(R,R)-butanediol dehydrogenase/meso-butanediol dehydrogenase/diacetyl reductase